MDLFSLGIGVLVGIGISGAIPKIPLAFFSAIKNKQYMAFPVEKEPIEEKVEEETTEQPEEENQED